MADPERPNPPPGTFGGLTGRQGFIHSPYLDFDPRVINPGANEAQWIFPDGAINRSSRGRFELAFSQIGGTVMTGAAVGGLIGGWNSLKSLSPSGPTGQVSWSVKRTQMLNYITKNGSNTANTLGVIAVVYSSLGVALSFINDSNDDLNTLVSGTATGLLYRGVAEPRVKEGMPVTRMTPQLRLRRAAVGGLFGFCASAAYVLLTNRDRFFR